MNVICSAFVLALGLSATASAAQVTLSVGQTAVLGDQKLILMSLQDSRCPPRVQCIRAGELRAKVLVSRANKVRIVELQYPEWPNTTWTGLRIVGAAKDEVSQVKPVLKVTFSDKRP